MHPAKLHFFKGIIPRKAALFRRAKHHFFTGITRANHHYFAAQRTTFSLFTTPLFFCRDRPRKLLPKHFKADDPTKRVGQSISDIFADFCGDLQLKQQLEVKN
jgi:hypothetical protein